MVKAKFVVRYFVLDSRDVDVRKLAGTYIALPSPDVESLYWALYQILMSESSATVIKTPEDIYYVAEGAHVIKNAKESYEFVIRRENGLRRVAEEILGVKRLKLDTVVNIVQAALWGLAILLGYLGYKNDALNEVSSYMALLFLLSGVIENFRRGYKKRERVRASAPHHASE
ncbi:MULTISPECIES: hypothetical protein [Thermococcus]|uniref:hypothetical protein n=1 Tax=Thermococcus TaxID=2263 RepID=UPI00143099C7|nr:MULTISPECIES: hypothetical protein [Thermococcus]NJE48823.1 hypothetical protein [Thermococcus sp. 9N3]CAI1494026.1 conserved protein of unknown function [Thermococcus nautili]